MEKLQPVLDKGDILLTLGAGDVWKVGTDMLDKLGETVNPNDDRQCLIVVSAAVSLCLMNPCQDYLISKWGRQDILARP